MGESAIEPFDVRNYYQRITGQDIGEVAREILGGHIKEEQGSTLFVDCPRHQSDSHRSFHVWTDKQGWYCHGCGKGGDVLQLVEFIQSGEVTTGRTGIMPDTHRHARDWLAARIGLPSLSHAGLSPEERKKVEAAQALTLQAEECLTALTEFYKNRLLANPEALQWLQEKYALDIAAVESFQIGYANNEGVIDYLKKAGFTLREMTASGAFRPDSQNDEIVYPVFEKRIIFPYISRGRTVFMIARKTPWTPDNKFEGGKYKKLPVHDPQKRPFIAPGIDNATLYNEDVLTAGGDCVIVTEGITDCISLINHGFTAISPVTVNISGHDWQRIIPKLRGMKKVILCQDNEISQVGWKGALRSANRLSKEKITCLVAQLPLEKEQKAAREKLEAYGITSGISSKELKKIQNERSLREGNEIRELLEQAKIDVCSFFVSGKTADDFKKVIDAALLPIEYAIQEIPENADQATIDPILVEIGKQPKAEQTRLIKKIQPKTGANLTELRSAIKDAVSADNHRQYEELRSQTQRKLGSPVLQRGNRAFYLVDNGILEQSVKETPNGPYIESKEIANFHIKIDHEEISDDGEFHDDGSTTLQKILSGKIIGKDWGNPFTIRADEWGSNNRLACRIS
ncbi:MAG: CHC2 zinc finger domain-containing protein, partial [bacterium]